MRNATAASKVIRVLRLLSACRHIHPYIHTEYTYGTYIHTDIQIYIYRFQFPFPPPRPHLGFWRDGWMAGWRRVQVHYSRSVASTPKERGNPGCMAGLDGLKNGLPTAFPLVHTVHSVHTYLPTYSMRRGRPAAFTKVQYT